MLILSPPVCVCVCVCCMGSFSSGDPRLIFCDRPLDDHDAPLSQYGVQHMSVIQVVLRIPGGGGYPGSGDGGMGDKGGKNRSMERLAMF